MALSSLTMDSLTTTSLILTAIFFIITTLLSIAFYRIYLSPLSHIPGPVLWRASRLPFAYNLFLGRLPYRISSLHEEYGPVVRVAPTEISFTTAEAWTDIYSVQKREDGVKVQMRKDPFMLLSPMEGSRDMIFELDDAEHARHRRIFSHAFSEKSLRDQEPIIAQHINRMSTRLHEISGKPVDMSAWFNYLLFDTIGDLVLGESLGCLETGTLHPWANTFFSFAKGITLMGMVERFWPLAPILMSFVPKSMQDAEAQHRAFTRDKLTNRLAKSSPRKDLISVVSPFLSATGPNSLTLTELHNNISVIVVAGSETTATALSGLMYYLLTNPDTLSLLTSEIRSTFARASDITMDTTRSLPYLNAVISESLRIYGPVPGQLRRITPAGGCVISGVHVPGGTIVAVDGYSSSHSASNFLSSKEFIPERWLSTSDLQTISTSQVHGTKASPAIAAAAAAPRDFSRDHKKVVQPFSSGPRNCIGQRLAMAEMRLVVARLVWEFEFEIEEECKGWVEGMKVYTLYERPPLMCRVKPVAERE